MVCKTKQSSFIIIYTLLLAFGNSFTVQRLDEGDIDQEGAPCQGTIIANRDTTFTTSCIISMSEKGKVNTCVNNCPPPQRSMMSFFAKIVNSC